MLITTLTLLTHKHVFLIILWHAKMSRSWRPWYHSLEAWQLHQQVLQKGPLFYRTFPVTKITPHFLQPLPCYVQPLWNQYSQTYQYHKYLLTQTDDHHYLFGVRQGQEITVQDVLPSEIAECWVTR